MQNNVYITIYRLVVTKSTLQLLSVKLIFGLNRLTSYVPGTHRSGWWNIHKILHTLPLNMTKLFPRSHLSSCACPACPGQQVALSSGSAPRSSAAGQRALRLGVERVVPRHFKLPHVFSGRSFQVLLMRMVPLAKRWEIIRCSGRCGRGGAASFSGAR